MLLSYKLLIDPALQDDAQAPDVPPHLVIENVQDTTSFNNQPSLPPPSTSTEAKLLPGSLPPGSTVIPNKEAVSNPTIDTFINEVDKMKKEEERKRSTASQEETKSEEVSTRRSSVTRRESKGAKSNDHPMTR